ncbi:DEAD-domain-containing protein [Schizopora paradoxa]|uniref:ATP-dependent RNA helicase n=1 Tax=Schizopora paradoxa TaxID=27342 RepID=A0A0H2SIS3_9AGAM|nr:DEAD-domain-containing protein [Schizopora paradoxa]
MDDLVLNLVDNGAGPSVKKSDGKGIRWTDRVKANRTLKRKHAKVHPVKQITASDETDEAEETPRPNKKARKSVQDATNPAKPSGPSKPTQFISSLFTSNPKVEVSTTQQPARGVVKPSNAPLTDRSTFEGLGLDPLIATHLTSKMNISAPTSIQREALSSLLAASGTELSDRDAFIQSQTGSGKTLSYLLPILQDLLPLSSLSYIERSIGTLAIIVAPTRELAKQISDVAEQLVSMRLRPKGDSMDDSISSTRLTRWLVTGLLIGGENKTHEKARLRKGLPILVSTPGRLLDHLQNTASFNVGKCRWLVLDEADRLMDLGFEETIKGILQGLEGRRKLAIQAVEEEKSLEVGGWDWTRRRRTILCSATIREDVQLLAGTTLVKPIIIKGLDNEVPVGTTPDNETNTPTDKFTPPSQLLQKCVVAPLKLRLVTLVSLLRMLLSQSRSKHGTKIIVFLSCTDSVDFHWNLLGKSSLDGSPTEPKQGNDEDSDASDSNEPKPEPIALISPLLPGASLYRLHGSLPLPTRLASLKGFSASPKSNKISEGTSTILLCTSVASRGLDLPLVRAVVQYDLPTEGGATEYVHRVGRTARAGKGGEAWSFIAPSEKEWIPWIEQRIQQGDEKDEKTTTKSSLVPASMDSVLKGGFGGTGTEFEERATEVQLAFERWVLSDPHHGSLAKKAYQSHMRAYATHPSDEKHIFHIRNLHIGHLAKAFALREAPSNIGNNSIRQKNGSRTVATKGGKDRASNAKTSGSTGKSRPSLSKKMESMGDHDTTAEKRMQDVVRAQGRLSKKGGVMMMSGTSEFHVSGGDELEKLVGQR